MKTVTLERFEIIKLAHPNAEIETRNGVEVVVIPTYDVNTDTIGETVMKLNRSETPEKFKPGDTLSHTKTGVPFSIVDPIARMLNIRKGPKSD